MAKKTIVFILLNFLLFLPIFATPKAKAEVDCLSLNPSSSDSDKAFCRNELNQIEAQLAELLAKQAEQKQKTGTLQSDINYLTTQINALKAKIKARGLVIAQLKVNITEKVKTINTLTEKINQEHESLGQLLRNTNEFDNENLVHLMLSDSSVSDFYSDFYAYDSINQAVKASVDTIRGIQTQTEAEKKALQKQQNAETDAKAELESAQKQVTASQAEQKQLLAISKNKEQEYAQLAAQKKAQADKIRNALFNLAGISQKIDFGTALQYANEVRDKTGIDPAFLLAILTQESNLGSNVGQCYLTATSGPQAGWGVNISSGRTWTNLMKPSRDVEPFLDITSTLVLDPLKTAVSCPINGNGYGGAMGPAQFIPSTWKLFASRLEKLLGHYANPWSPEDAFMAAGIYLTDLKAVGTSQSAQNRAACSYYGTGGSSCSYSRNVAKLKATIQANIDLLQ